MEFILSGMMEAAVPAVLTRRGGVRNIVAGGRGGGRALQLAMRAIPQPDPFCGGGKSGWDGGACPALA